MHELLKQVHVTREYHATTLTSSTSTTDRSARRDGRTMVLLFIAAVVVVVVVVVRDDGQVVVCLIGSTATGSSTAAAVACAVKTVRSKGSGGSCVVGLSAVSVCMTMVMHDLGGLLLMIRSLMMIQLLDARCCRRQYHSLSSEGQFGYIEAMGLWVVRVLGAVAVELATLGVVCWRFARGARVPINCLLNESWWHW